jgi:hypothetical protein
VAPAETATDTFVGPVDAVPAALYVRDGSMAESSADVSAPAKLLVSVYAVLAAARELRRLD